MGVSAGDAAMLLRRSGSVLRLMIGLALGFGFLGFATQSRAEENESTWIRPQSEAELEQVQAPEWIPDPMLQAAVRAGIVRRDIRRTGIGAAPPMVWRDGQGLITVLRPGVLMLRNRKGVVLSLGGSF